MWVRCEWDGVLLNWDGVLLNWDGVLLSVFVLRWGSIELRWSSIEWDGVVLREMKCLWSEMELWNVFDVNWCVIHVWYTCHLNVMSIEYCLLLNDTGWDVWYTCLNVLLLNDTLASFCWYTLRQLPHFDDTLWHSCLILWIQKIKIA